MNRCATFARVPRASAPGIGLAIGGLLALGLSGVGQGIPSAAVLIAASTISSQCQPLPTPATTSASPASSPSAADAASSSASSVGELCISVRNAQPSIKPGQAASFTVQVSAQNGPVPGVSVTLGSAGSGQEPVFTSRCPNGDGTASCMIGSLDTSVSPSSYQMQAQIKVGSSAASGTLVTLIATADAAVSPPMTTLPAATGSVTVSAPPASASPSPSPTSTRSAIASATSLAAAPTLGTMPAAVTTTSSVVSPGNISSILPGIAPSPSPALGALPSSAADVRPDLATKASEPVAGDFTLVMPAATAEVLGLIILALVISLATTKLFATGHLSVRRRSAEGPGCDGSAKKRSPLRRFGPSAGLRRRRPRANGSER